MRTVALYLEEDDIVAKIWDHLKPGHGPRRRQTVYREATRRGLKELVQKGLIPGVTIEVWPDEISEIPEYRVTTKPRPKTVIPRSKVANIVHHEIHKLSPSDEQFWSVPDDELDAAVSAETGNAGA